MDGLTKLGVDFTSLIFYIINFGIIVWVLARYVYKPVIQFMDQRRTTIEQNIEESELLRRQFAEQLTAKEEETKAVVAKLREELVSTRQAAEEQARTILAEAQTERQRIVGEAQNEAKQVQHQLEQQIEDQLIKKVGLLVNEAVKHNVDADDASGQIRKLWRDIQAQDYSTNTK